MDWETQFIEFREFHKIQHPASVPHESMYAAVSETPAWLPFAVLAMFVSASLLSGVHTINTVYRLMETTDALLPGWVYGVVSIGSFVGVELALLLSAYLIVREAVWGWAVLSITFLFAMSANLYSVSRALANSSSSATLLFTVGTVQITGELVVAVIMGIGAPLMALMAGKMYVNINRSERRATLTSRAQYQAALLAYDEMVIADFNKVYGKRKAPKISISNPSNGIPLEIPLENERKMLPSNSTLGHKKQPNATQVVEDYLLEHPEALEINPVELAALLGVGKSTVYNVLKSKKGD